MSKSLDFREKYCILRAMHAEVRHKLHCTMLYKPLVAYTLYAMFMKHSVDAAHISADISFTRMILEN